MGDSSTHFVAHLKIERVDVPLQAPNRTVNPDAGKRVISEVSQITLKSNTLSKLIEKMGQHIEIIEED